MKLIDRYVLRTFILNYLISLFVLIGLYVVLDMVFNFDELVKTQTKEQISTFQATVGIARDVADYYFYKLFPFFVQLSGVIPVVAAAFTLLRLSRFNELTAVLVAGVPLLRVAAPIIISAAALNLILLPVVQELIIPNIIPKLVRSHDEVRDLRDKSFPIFGLRDDANSIVTAARYFPGVPGTPPSMMYFDLVERGDDYSASAHTRADRATWDVTEGVWRLDNGVRISGLAPDQRATPPEPIAAYRSNVTPVEIALYHRGDFVQYLATAQINQLLAQKRAYGVTSMLRIKHTRFTQVILNIVLVCLTIPCVLTREPGQLKSAAAKCLTLIGACMGTIFLCYQLAGNPPAGGNWVDVWPALMAWMPALIFAPIAIFMLERIKT